MVESVTSGIRAVFPAARSTTPASFYGDYSSAPPYYHYPPQPPHQNPNPNHNPNSIPAATDHHNPYASYAPPFSSSNYFPYPQSYPHFSHNPDPTPLAFNPTPPPPWLPPPPVYGFHNLDHRTIVLADSTVRSYFALPPDYSYVDESESTQPEPIATKPLSQPSASETDSESDSDEEESETLAPSSTSLSFSQLSSETLERSAMKGMKPATVASKKPAAEMLKAKAEPKRTTKSEKAPKAASKKDVNAPKRPATAFFIFMEEFRKSYKLEFPDSKSVAAVGKAGGEKWKSMSATEKARNSEVGGEGGYHIGHSKHFSSSSVIVFKTAGTKLEFNSSGYLNVLRKNGEKLNIKDVAVSASSFYLRATLNYDGVLALYSYPKSSTTNVSWSLVWSLPDDICAHGIGVCGYNSICTLQNQRPTCTCPERYSLLDPNDPYGNCKPDSGQSCEEDEKTVTKDLYVTVLTKTDWLSSHYVMVRPSSAESCNASCFEDCLCAVAIFIGSDCYKKSLPLSNGRVDSSLGTQAFMKVRKGNFTIFAPPVPQMPKRKNQTTLIRVGSALLGTSFFANLMLSAIVCLGFFFIYKRKHVRFNRRALESNLHSFSYEDLKEATNSFDEELGKGAFGVVYKGILQIGSGIPVAVKKLNFVVQDSEKEFMSELNIIGQTRHKNLVKLVGYCDEGQERLLVYEFLSNGTLASYFVGDTKPSWRQRIDIAYGVAKGLAYLHEECSKQIIHCDIKPQNILLDEYCNARIADFGLAKSLKMNQSQTQTAIRGIKGYVATSISPPAAEQIISSIRVLLGEDGSNRGAQKLARIRENNNFFRSELQKMGFEVLGDNDSPVMPIMLYNPVKIPAFSRECLKQNVVVVTVAFPATPLLLAKAPIYISASHTREDLQKALDALDYKEHLDYDVVEDYGLVTSAATLQTFDLVTMKIEEVDFTASVVLEPKLEPNCDDATSGSTKLKSEATRCYGIVLWFETGFTSRFCTEKPAVLSTSPYTPPTHWMQTILTFQEPLAVTSEKSSVDRSAGVGTEVCPASRIQLRISIARASQHRNIDISLETTGIDHSGSAAMEMDSEDKELPLAGAVNLAADDIIFDALLKMSLQPAELKGKAMDVKAAVEH